MITTASENAALNPPVAHQTNVVCDPLKEKVKKISANLNNTGLTFARAFCFDSSWDSLINLITVVQTISLGSQDIYDKVPKAKKKRIYTKAEEQLNEERKINKASCDTLSKLIVKDIGKRPYKELEELTNELERLNDKWLTLRSTLKPEAEFVKKVPSFSLVLSVVQGRLKTMSGHKRLEDSLKNNDFNIEDNGTFHSLHTRVGGQPLRFLVHPTDKKAIKRMKDFPKFVVQMKEILRPLFEKLGTTKISLVFDKPCTFSVSYVPTLQQQQKFLEEEKFEVLETYYKNYPFVLPCIPTDLLFGDRTRFSQDQINSLFLKLQKFPTLTKHISYYVQPTTLEIAEVLLRTAIDIKKNDIVTKVLSQWPYICLKDGTNKDLLYLIENGFLKYAGNLIINGMAADAQCTFFDFKHYHQVQTSLGCCINYIEKITAFKRKDDLEVLKVTEVVEFFNFLLISGADANQKMSSDGSSEHDCSILERCFYNRTKHDQLFTELAEILLASGAQITPRVAQAMLLEMKATRNTRFVKDLIKQQYLSELQLPHLLGQDNTAQTHIGQLLEQSIDTVVWLEKMNNRLYRIASGLDLDKITKARSLKKALKQILKNCEAAKQIPDPAVVNIYQTLVKSYDNVITQDLLLSELRAVSHEIRTLAKSTDPYKHPSQRLVRFYGLWSTENSHIYKDAETRVAILFTETGKQYWEVLRNRVVDIATKVSEDRYLSRHKITWLHGTMSTTLPLILQMRALEPLGGLLKQNIPTFGGEICGTDQTINAKHVSGERLTASWEEGMHQWYEAITRGHTCKVYATQARGYRPKERTFKPELSWERASVSHIESLLPDNPEWGVGRHGLWTVVRLDILKLRATDKSPEAIAKLNELKKYIVETLATEKLSKENKEEMESLLVALEKEVKVFFSEEELRIIHDPNAYGIIFGSTTEYSEPTMVSIDPMEYIIDGPISLGDKVQLVFTSPEKVEELGRMLKPYGIRVYDFETVFFLEMMQMIGGSRHRQLRKNLEGQPEIVKMQKQISLALQQDILPGYADPYLEKPKYSLFNESGERKVVQIPAPYFGSGIKSHAEYLEKIKSGEIFPREVHGLLHATRTAILTQLVLKLYKAEMMTTDEEIDQGLLAIAAAAHDRGRQDDGEDHWDRSSSKWLMSYLLYLGCDEVTISQLTHAVEVKDPKGRKFTTTHQRCVHDADALEIVRPGTGIGIADFRKEELCFYNELNCEGFDKDDLIAEIQDFIMKTENPSFKMKIEAESQDVYGDLLRGIHEANKLDGSYPMIMKLLGDEISAHCL